MALARPEGRVDLCIRERSGGGLQGQHMPKPGSRDAITTGRSLVRVSLGSLTLLGLELVETEI